MYLQLCEVIAGSDSDFVNYQLKSVECENNSCVCVSPTCEVKAGCDSAFVNYQL